MKHTIAENRQMFNVKSIADSVSLDNLAEGQFGVYDVNSSTSVGAATTFANLPDEIRIVSKLNGKVYYSFDTIKKTSIKNQLAKAYQAEQINIWKTEVTGCECIKDAVIKIGLEEDSLLRRDGMTWTHGDSMVQGTPDELKCSYDCTGHPVYDNNAMTKHIWEKINSVESPFYEAEVQKQDGTVLDAAGIDAFIAANKDVNTDDDDSNDGENLVLFIKGKVSDNRNYKDLDVNHIFPRGVKLFPSIILNGKDALEFTEVQELQYQIGAGSDMRAEEFDVMSLYTNLNFAPQLSDGLAVDDLVYQFENGKTYNTVTFEFYTDKVNKNDGDKRSFLIMLGAEETAVFNALKTMFGV